MRYCLFLFLVTPSVFCQQSVKGYEHLVREADSLYKSGSFRKAAQTYTDAFRQNEWKGFIPDLYNSARSWAMIGNLDSAFRKLDRVITYARHNDFESYKDFPRDPAFKSLHGDDRWQALILKADKKYNNPLIGELDIIFKRDQEYRLLIDTVIARSGADSEEAMAVWKAMSAADSANLLKVTDILDKHGWVGPDVVGQRGNITLFLVIQHADLDTQVKYLPMMREAASKGDADPSHLALLEDRVALKQGRKQIYGSQVAMDKQTGKYFLEPLEDPANVDKRRAAVGLPPLAAYLKQWGIAWDVDEYQEQMEKERSH